MPYLLGFRRKVEFMYDPNKCNLNYGMQIGKWQNALYVWLITTLQGGSTDIILQL